MTSTRLPGKSMLGVAGKPLARLAAERAGNTGVEVVAALPEGWLEDPLADELAAAGVVVMRGSLADVLGRYCDAIADLPDDAIVVRLTADNCFPDGDFVDEIADALEATDLPYVGVDWPGSGLPYGMSAEAFRAGALREAAAAAHDPYEREHVTPWLKNRCAERFSPAEWGRDISALRCTVDGMLDYLRVTAAFEDVCDPIRVGWRELCGSLERAAQDRPHVGSVRQGGAAHGELVLGTAQLGLDYGRCNSAGKPSESSARELVLEALQSGVSEFDTARAYGDAEVRVADALVSGLAGAARVVTKLDPLSALCADTPAWQARMMARDSVLRSCRDLRMRELPVLLLHRWSHRHFSDGAIWDELVDLRDAGFIGGLGASVQSPDEAVQAAADPDVVHIQLPVNLLDRRWEDAGLPQLLAERPDCVVHARSVLLQGLLAGSPQSWPTVPGVDADEICRVLDVLVAKLGRASRVDLCIAFVRSLDWVDGLVMGMDDVSQLRDNVALFQQPPLTAEERAYVRNVLPRVPDELVDPSNWS